VAFAPEYARNPLVNVLCLGLVPRGRIFRARAEGVGNTFVYVGARTGRDGIHGATMASEAFDETSSERRPTVQVGDPFTEKLLLEACLEAMATGAVVGIQDMGAAGLACSASEMPARAGTGMEVELDRVPRRETGMTPYEILLSESQERMLVVGARGREEDIRRVFAKWELDAVEIGTVTAQPELTIRFDGAVVARLPVDALSEAPVYEKPTAAPAYLSERRAVDPLAFPFPAMRPPPWRPCSRRPRSRQEWAYRQVRPAGQDQHAGAARVRCRRAAGQGTRRALAVATDGNAGTCSWTPAGGWRWRWRRRRGTSCARARARSASRIASTSDRPSGPRSSGSSPRPSRASPARAGRSSSR
jgi:phosphoribosylformylglycinamidine synthase